MKTERISVLSPECCSCGSNTCKAKDDTSFANIPEGVECWEFFGSQGDKSCALYRDMKISDCTQCFFFKIKTRATETVQMVQDFYNNMQMQKES